MSLLTRIKKLVLWGILFFPFMFLGYFILTLFKLEEKNIFVWIVYGLSFFGSKLIIDRIFERKRDNQIGHDSENILDDESDEIIDPKY